MGAARRRGTFDERKAQAIARKADEQAKVKEIVERVEKRVAASKKPYPENLLPAGFLASLALSLTMKGKK